ncbi:Endochitinase B1 [Fusarium oxysporum f. sp. albedinis]|nr:Endochitinase B1 [Fusarium oxysporum f. sp. albedinis]
MQGATQNGKDAQNSRVNQLPCSHNMICGSTVVSRKSCNRSGDFCNINWGLYNCRNPQPPRFNGCSSNEKAQMGNLS